MKNKFFPAIIIALSLFCFFSVVFFFANQKNLFQKNSSGTVYGEMDSAISQDATTVALPEINSEEIKTDTEKIETELRTTDSSKSQSAEETETKETTTSKDTSDSLSGDNKNSDENKSVKNTSVTPKFYFVGIKNEQVIQNIFEIKSSVEMAESVELFLVPSGSNTHKYIGNAKEKNTNDWQLSFNSVNFPNGSFYLIASIKNKYGTYQSEKIKINISNQTTQKEENQQQNQEQKSSSQEVQENNPEKENFNGSTSNEWQEKYFKNKFCFEEESCGENADPDKDGLDNKEEFRLKTNPLAPDSDNDGYLDGDEIKNGFNPLKYSPGDKSDKIIFENPKETGEIKKEVYQITAIKLEKNSQKENNEKIILSGKGLPNSFVNVYIYSSLPTILTVKTDTNGNWSYELEKQLDEGQHEVYVAITDNTGKITAKSEPMFFFKTAQAVEIIPANEIEQRKYFSAPPSPVENRKRDYILIILGIISLSLLFSIIFVSLYAIRMKIKNKETI